MVQMEMETKRIGNVIILYPEGNLDLNLTNYLEQVINEFIENEPEINLILNFKNIHHVISSTIGMLIAIKKKLNKGNRKILLTNINDTIEDLMKVIAVEHILKIYDNEEDAINSL